MLDFAKIYCSKNEPWRPIKLLKVVDESMLESLESDLDTCMVEAGDYMCELKGRNSEPYIDYYKESELVEYGSGSYKKFIL
jgi:hypothetical protein